MWVRFLYFSISENPNYNAGGEVNLLVTQMVTIHLSRYWYHMVKLEYDISPDEKYDLTKLMLQTTTKLSRILLKKFILKILLLLI